MPQRAIGSFVRHENKRETTKGVRTYRKYWIYVPGELAEEKNFQSDTWDRLTEMPEI
jgi:hypothetical protein